MMHVFLLWLLFTVAYVKGVASSSCDLIGLNLCAWQLGQNVSELYQEELSALPSADQIVHLCGFQHQFQSCYRSKLRGCETNLIYMATLASTQKNVDFICSDGREEMIRHNDCWKINVVHKTSNQCFKDHIHNIQQHLRTSEDPLSPESSNILCRIMNTSKLCMIDVVKQNCIAEAAEIVQDMMDKTMENLSSHLQCSGSMSSSTVTENYSILSHTLTPTPSSTIKFTSKLSTPPSMHLTRSSTQKIASSNLT